jgi:hypothetical protein
MRYLYVVENNIKGFNINEESALYSKQLHCAGVTTGAGTVYPSRAPEFTPSF